MSDAIRDFGGPSNVGMPMTDASPSAPSLASPTLAKLKADIEACLYDNQTTMDFHEYIRVAGPHTALLLIGQLDQSRQVNESLRATLLQREEEIARLREMVRKLPTPWRFKFLDSVFQCDWCLVTTHCETREKYLNPPVHPDNDCLYVEAQKGAR